MSERQQDFAVVNVLTTGFGPGSDGRIAEIAVVRLDPSGREVGRLESLINPGTVAEDRAGVGSLDLKDAPDFGDLLGHVARLCDDAVLTSHRDRYDVTVLLSELARAGFPLDDPQRLSTMRLARDVLPGQASYRLRALCKSLGIEVPDDPSAGRDAEATARLLSKLLERSGGRELPLQGRRRSWPEVPAKREAVPRKREPVIPPEVAFLKKILGNMPTRGAVMATDENADVYLELLGQALEDRVLTDREALSLAAVASDLDLSQESVGLLHREFWHQLCVSAWLDGVVTDEERAMMRSAAECLSISREEQVAIEDAAKAEAEDIDEFAEVDDDAN